MTISKDGQGHPQPDRDGMRSRREVYMEQQVRHPGNVVFFRRNKIGREVTVKVDSERNIGQHREKVRYRHPGENEVDWGQHVLPGQDRYVDEVCRNSEETDNQTQVTMYTAIPGAELFQGTFGMNPSN